MTEYGVEFTVDDASRRGFILKGTAGRTYHMTDYIGKEEKVVIPDKVGEKSITSIGQIAFMRRKDVVSVTIPSTVTNIDSRAFSECYKMKHIFVSEDNPVYKDKNGILLSKDGTRLFRVPEGTEGIFLVPEGVKEICRNAFAGCQKIEGIRIPACVTEIDDNAASNCAAFRFLSVAGDNPVYQERNGALFNKEGNKLLRVPEGLTGRFAVPDNVEEICTGAFRGCCWLDSIFLPSGLKKIHDHAFYACVKIRTIDLPDSVQDLGAHAFAMCVNLESIRLPRHLEEIRECTFGLCKMLGSIRLPGSIKKIGSEAFYKCKVLESIHFPDGLTVIDKYAFNGCNSLTRINLPESLNFLGEGAFKDCSMLKKVHIASKDLDVNPGIFGGTTRASIQTPYKNQKK